MSEDRGRPGRRGAPGAAAAAADAWACADLEAAEFTHPLPCKLSCTTFLPCLACAAPAGLHTSHKYNTSLFIGIFCCVLKNPLTSILPNPPLPSLLAMRGYPAATASHFHTLWFQRLPVNHLQKLEVKDFLCYQGHSQFNHPKSRGESLFGLSDMFNRKKLNKECRTHS